MLGFVRGIVISKSIDSTQCVVLAHRVGYEIVLPKHTYESFELKHTVSLWLHSHVREDAFTLFGFATENEKQFFRLLLSVNGLGPKTALALITTHGARLANLVIQKDSDGLSEAPGVGKKLAQKLVLELSGKIEKLTWLNAVTAPRTEQAVPTSMREDLVSALLNLGYQPSSVKFTIDRLLERTDSKAHNFEAMLKMALKDMSGRITSSTSEVTANG